MSLIAQLEAVLPAGISIPAELRQLYQWIEIRGCFTDGSDGSRVGFLFPQEQLSAMADDVWPAGTCIEFSAGGNEHLHHWFGHRRPEVLDRLCVFARTGTDGSMAAFWLADDGIQKIVHLGSGSGSDLVCVLAEDPVDFLRLLAIGYVEICWRWEFSGPPAAGEELVLANVPFQNWVTETFATTIPHTASEIVKTPSGIDEADPADEFARWVNLNNA